PGGDWKLANIVDYMQSGAFALLRNAARYRERWLRDFYRIGKEAVRERKPGEPFALLIPPLTGSNFWQLDGLRRLESILARGEVETITAATAFEADAKQYPPNTKIVPLAQPYGAFAKTLLERQRYPDLREYPGGPPRRPYDVTAHTLPLLMGVDVVRVDKPFKLPTDQRTGFGYNGGIGNPAEIRVGLYKSYAASMDEGWTRWVLDQYKDPIMLRFKLSYSSVTDADIRTGNLELKLVAKGTQVPYSMKEEAEAAAKSATAGGDPYTAQWETAYYRERPDTNGSIMEGWVVVGKNPVITGLDVRDVSAKPSPFGGSTYAIDFSLTPNGTKRMADATSKHVGDHLAIVLNSEVKS